MRTEPDAEAATSMLDISRTLCNIKPNNYSQKNQQVFTFDVED